MLLHGTGYSGSPEWGPHLARQPPPWGPHSMQLPEIKDPVCSQAEQTVSAHSPAPMGDGCASECISLSHSQCCSFPLWHHVLRHIYFSSLTGGGLCVFLSPPVQLFQNHSVILPPTKTALHSPSRNPPVSPRSFLTSSLGGSSVCGPVFEPSTSKRFHVAPHAHLYGRYASSNFEQLKQQRSKFCRLS